MDMRLEDHQSRAANSLAYSWPKQCSYIIKCNNLISRLLYREWLPEQNSLKDGICLDIDNVDGARI
jgi:hypothetical protein